MSRSRAFVRDMAERKAVRRKKLSDSWMQYYPRDSYYPSLGYYRKGKIHCSCGMCMKKTRNKGYKRRHIHGNYAPSINYKASDLRKIISMNEQELEYWSNLKTL